MENLPPKSFGKIVTNSSEYIETENMQLGILLFSKVCTSRTMHDASFTILVTNDLLKQFPDIVGMRLTNLQMIPNQHCWLGPVRWWLLCWDDIGLVCIVLLIDNYIIASDDEKRMCVQFVTLEGLVSFKLELTSNVVFTINFSSFIRLIDHGCQRSVYRAVRSDTLSTAPITKETQRAKITLLQPLE